MECSMEGSKPVRDRPLAVCDQRTINAADLQTVRFFYPDREGEICVARHSERHQWMYVSDLTADEVLLIKCYDSERAGPSGFFSEVLSKLFFYHVPSGVPSAHTAFELPNPDGHVTAPRQSIEMRTIAFWPRAGARL